MTGDPISEGHKRQTIQPPPRSVLRLELASSEPLFHISIVMLRLYQGTGRRQVYKADVFSSMCSLPHLQRESPRGRMNPHRVIQQFLGVSGPLCPSKPVKS